ncbi:Isoleucine--tRNA ligase, chloroplastic/mitochondrial-like protein [Drosera capensis]
MGLRLRTDPCAAAVFSASITPRSHHSAAAFTHRSTLHTVFDRRSCWSLRGVSCASLFGGSRSMLVDICVAESRCRFCTWSSGGCMSSSRRRSRGLVMAAKKDSEGVNQAGKYKDTVNLPKTTFGMRENSLVKEPEIQKLWKENQVFKRVVERNDGGTFTPHDGPPYANGDLHIGHALNKILKDIINRYKLLQNFKVQYVPGWDCHGLPIDPWMINLGKDLTPLKLRAKAANFVRATMKAQRHRLRLKSLAEWSFKAISTEARNQFIGVPLHVQHLPRLNWRYM